MAAQGLSEISEQAESIKLETALEAAGGLMGSAWSTVTSPFVVFGPEQPVTNVLFFASISLLVYNVIQAPKQ